MSRKKIVILTGAGISAESGIKTFRDSDGLWENYNVMDVATIDAYERNPELVVQFYNERRRQANAAKPNAAHFALKDLEQSHDVHIITQNVDDLHERAGSSNILHLHGRLNSIRTLHPIKPHYAEIAEDLVHGSKGPDGYDFRPDIVWFGEDVPNMFRAEQLVSSADILVVIGTSLQVYPAAGLLYAKPYDAELVVIDKRIPSVGSFPNMKIIEAPATEGVDAWVKELLSQ